MITERAVETEPVQLEREDYQSSAEVLVKKGALEVVTTSSGVVLYIIQSQDD